MSLCPWLLYFINNGTDMSIYYHFWMRLCIKFDLRKTSDSLTRIERVSFWLPVRCSNHLSYMDWDGERRLRTSSWWHVYCVCSLDITTSVNAKYYLWYNLILHRHYHLYIYTEIASKLTATASVAQSVELWSRDPLPESTLRAHLNSCEP